MESVGGGYEKMNGILKCPVCSKALDRKKREYKCPDGHSFDIAKEDYVNLLVSSKNGDLKGDDKYSARSRRDFLNRGYY
jgi:23S rRNA (guanine745-N1)-methyltransferase